MMNMISEHELARSTGISMDAMRELRKQDGFVEGIHWARKKKAVHWTEEGREALAAVLRLEKNCAPPRPAQALVELVVVRLVPNPRIVFCRKKNAGEDGPLVRLRVRSSENFMAGMEVRACRPVEGSGDLFEMEGNCPRWKGRW